MKPIYVGMPFAEELMKYFLKILKNEPDILLNNEEFNNIKTKVARKEYIKENTYPSLFDQVLDIVKEKYQMDDDKEEDMQVLENLEELLDSHEIKTKITNKMIKKYVI